MALSRRRREEPNIWAGFVDAVTTLLMVMMFILTILTVAQSVLRDTINSQSSELSELNAQVAQLAEALGLERTKADALKTEVGSLQASLTAAETKGAEQGALILDLTAQLTGKQQELGAAQSRIASFEAQVASLLADATTQKTQIAALQDAQARTLSEQEALNLALAKARSEIDAGAEAARLAAARREALEALIASLRQEGAAKAAELSEAEKQRLVDAAAAQALQDKLKGADAELTAMTLALEEQRKKAEETLTLLAAAEAARDQTSDQKAEALAMAQKILSEKEEQIAAQARNVTLLNQQMTALRSQLAELQGLLDASAAKDADNKVQIAALGSKLNQALAQVASEQKARADLEAAEAARLRNENLDLAKYRSEFFGELSKLLADTQGVQVVGDRFVFSSEVLFQPGAADLSPEGQAQIAEVVQTLNQVIPQIPAGLNWVIRVDGHTDATPLSGTGAFKDNWQLSQARALAVVRYMTETLGFPPSRLAANGFGEFQPVAEGDSPEALAQNRRIELKLTER
ncbi:peptidoglycan -binding protein [Rhodobacter sp. KR11]|uniref:peptidoglycan -binding protein n=1 Tax=Rhodobacter sp. KR11 TaxID=2974588 RepID=UPI0022213B79|nr:peptidoglycan -binding protein [Rhodobacter sp. KR11]MCW1919671.1 peptidoglycan -binding protein [Rhodobacter sp. KR11]